MRPICVKCALAMSCAKNEFLVKDAAAVDPEGVKSPSTCWSGDLYHCPSCGILIVTGFGGKMEDTGKEALVFRHSAPPPPEPNEVEKALLDVLDDNQRWFAIKTNTGLPDDRCKEIEALFIRLSNKFDPQR